MSCSCSADTGATITEPEIMALGYFMHEAHIIRFKLYTLGGILWTPLTVLKILFWISLVISQCGTETCQFSEQKV